MTEQEVRFQARRAIVVTCAIYVVFGAMRLASPVVGGFLLVAAFYFLPGWLLRGHPEIAREDQVGPESPIPPWSRQGVCVAVVAALVHAGCNTQLANDFHLTGWRLARSLKKETVMRALDDLVRGTEAAPARDI